MQPSANRARPRRVPSPVSHGAPQPASKKTLAWSLGAFVGHIARGVRTPVSPSRVELTRETQTTERDSPMGKVIVRRTTVEELEVRPDPTAHQFTPQGPGTPPSAQQDHPR